MTERVPLAVIGAGPAGLAAAVAAAEARVPVLLIDDQPAAGGQIYRALGAASPRRLAVLGDDYARGRRLLAALDRAPVRHLAGATVWHVSPAREIRLSREGGSRTVEAEQIILATGALERPMPFPRWTLPGVMTAGGAQILLKTAGLAADGAVLAGSGPLLVLLAWQYLRAGARLGAIVETAPRANAFKALAHLPGALRANAYLRQGLAMLREIRRRRIPRYRGAARLEALGDARVAALRFDSGGRRRELSCSVLLLHQGVVPDVRITRALGLAHAWDPRQRCWRPRCGPWGETEVEGIALAGDGRGIGGAAAAEHQGRLAGLHAAWRLGALSGAEAERRARAERRALVRHMAVRPFLDALYAPAAEFLAPPDRTIVCRCEEVSAGAIREAVRLGCRGPNQVKAFTRAGMGPCQGRLCGPSVSGIVAEARGVPVARVGDYRVRPPLKPVSLGELAAMPGAVGAAHEAAP